MQHNLEDQTSILIVDDHAISRAMLRDYIEFIYPTCRVLEAENGKAGLEVAQTQQPDLILLDLRMPVMNGYEMALALQDTAATRPIPLVLCTCEDSSDPHVISLSTICREILTKPLSLSKLQNALRQILSSGTPMLQAAACPA